MGFWDNPLEYIQTSWAGTLVSNSLTSASKVAGSNTFQNVVSLAATGYDIYQGIQKQKAADRMFDLMWGTAATQDAWATEIKTRYTNTYWPLEDSQYSYYSEDLVANRPSDVAARDYNITRKYEQISQAAAINPELDTTERALISTLIDDTATLRARLAADAVLGVNQSFDATRAQDTRRMGVLGINPSSGARLGYTRALAGAQALATATARNNAAIIAEDTAISRQGQALSYRAGVPLPTYQVTPSVQAGNVTTALSSVGSIAAATGAHMDTSAQQSFTGAATALNNMYMRPYVQKYMESINQRQGIGVR